MKTKYVTTAIFYPNSRLHVGHAWECAGADWLARGLKALGHPVFFSTGTDEHSIKVAQAAEAQGISPKAHCDRMAADIQKVLAQLGMSYDRFIRTSDPDHHQVVQELVQKVYDSGDIYKATYEGHYCEGCEAFYTEKDLVDGKCPTHGVVPKWITEENYFFRLSKYQEALLKLFRDRPDFLQPSYRVAEVVNFIEAGLRDFSISRSTFDWGIPLPWDPKHIVYVWFDALINYVTAAGLKSAPAEFEKRWPATVHIIGKDITRFHCVYWPAMLMAMGLPLPERVFAHGFMNLKGARMSKSSGNRVTPDEVMGITGPDPFRYYLLAENNFASDGNFDWDAMVLKCNADLANDWGNLVNRTINMTRKYFPEQELGAPARATHSVEVRESFAKLVPELEAAVDRIDPSGYAQAATARSRVLNLYIDRTKPWALAKQATPEAMAELQEVLYTLMEGIRWIATALMPVLPFGMPEVFRQLNVPVPSENGALRALKWGETRFRPGEPKPIYPRLELPKQEEAVAPTQA